MEFFIDPEYLCSQTVQTAGKFVPVEPEAWPSDVLEELSKTDNVVTMTKMIDHPKFTELREDLGQKGYITIQRSWWNGDVVQKNFKLNGYQFNKGDIFCCAAALSVKFAVHYGTVAQR